MSVEPASEAIALELLEQAMELAPRDPLPLALAAWCHGLHGGHNFSPAPDHEKSMACTLAERAARLSNGDPLTETFIAAGYTLAHDLAEGVNPRGPSAGTRWGFLLGMGATRPDK